MFRDLNLYKKISISNIFEVVKFLTLLVNLENFEWPATNDYLTYRILVAIFQGLM